MKKAIIFGVIITLLFGGLNVIYPKCFGEHVLISELKYKYYSEDCVTDRVVYYNKKEYKEKWHEIDNDFELDVIMDSLSEVGTRLEYADEYTIEGGLIRFEYSGMSVSTIVTESKNIAVNTPHDFYEDILENDETQKRFESDTGISTDTLIKEVEIRKNHYFEALNQIRDWEYQKVVNKIKRTVMGLLVYWGALILIAVMTPKVKSVMKKRRETLKIIY